MKKRELSVTAMERKVERDGIKPESTLDQLFRASCLVMGSMSLQTLTYCRGWGRRKVETWTSYVSPERCLSRYQLTAEGAAECQHTAATFLRRHSHRLSCCSFILITTLHPSLSIPLLTNSLLSKWAAATEKVSFHHPPPPPPLYSQTSLSSITPPWEISNTDPSKQAERLSL